MRELIKLAIYAAIAAAAMVAIHTAWTGFKDRIGAPYAEAQRAKDEPILNAAKKAQADAESDRNTARGNSAKCEAALTISDAGMKEWSAAAIAADAKAKQSKAENDKIAADAAPRIAQLQRDAAAKPQLMTCQAELAKADKVLTDALKQRGHK